MNWIKNTGSPSTGHPFYSLNPEADIFVPRQGNSAPAEESSHPVVPPPFSKPENIVKDTSPSYEDRTVVANNFSEKSLPRHLYITEQPVTTNLYQENDAQKPESYYIEENSTDQNDVEDCQTVEEIPIEESPIEDEIVDSNEQIPNPLEEEHRHHSPELYSDQNFRNRDNFRGRGSSGYSNRRGGRGNYRGRHRHRGEYFNDTQYRRPDSRFRDDNNVHLSSDKPKINEESTYEQPNSSRVGWGPQGPTPQHYRDNGRENRRRTLSNDKPKRENIRAEYDSNNSRNPREIVDNRGRRRGTYPNSRGGNHWRGKNDGPKYDKSRYGGRQDRRNANSSEDELRICNDESGWGSSHITDDSNNAWDLDGEQNIERQPADLQRSQTSTGADNLDKQDKKSSTSYNNDVKHFSDSRRSFDEDDNKDLPSEGTNSMDELTPGSHSKVGGESSNKQHEKRDRHQGSSRTRGVGRGRTNIDSRQDKQNWREKRNRDDDTNNERQNRQRTFPNYKHEQESNAAIRKTDRDWNNSRDQNQALDGRIGRRGTYSDSRGSNQRQGNYDGPKTDKTRDGGRQNQFSHGQNSQKDIDCSEDDLKIINDESSSDNYHITDDDSNDTLDLNMEQKRQPDWPKSGDSENSNSWNEAVDFERNQSSNATNTLEKQEKYTFTNDDTKETLHKSSKFSKKSGRSSQSSNKQVSKSSRSFDEDGATDLPEGTNLMDTLLSHELSRRSKMSPDSHRKNNTQNEEDKSKAKDLTKQSEETSDSRKSLDDDNDDPSSTRLRKPFDVKKNDNVVERIKKLKQSTGPQKYLDPRMEREKLNKSCGSVVLEDEGDRKKKSQLDGNNKQRRITSYFESSGDRDLWDKEFDLWEKRWQSIKEFKRVDEVAGDLFEQPKEYSLAHCVAEDLRMGSGIAVAFKREFKNLPDLLDQKARQGGLATLHDEANNRYVYYLVTKRESTGKPTYFTLWKSLCRMRDHVKQNEVKKIAVPRLACGLDRLEWDRVKSMLESLFKDVDVEIRVCNFQQNEIMEEKKSKTCKLVVEESPVTKIATGTLILYLATSDGKQDDIISNLSKKFNFWPSFQVNKSKNLGDIVYYDDKGQNFGLCGCIVRRTSKDEISFKSLHMCIQNVNKMNKQFGKDMFVYVAFQWVDEKAYYDDLINQKIITLLIGFLRNVDVYVCRGSFGDEGE